MSTEKENQDNPQDLFRLSTLIRISTGGGGGEMSLPLSEIVGTDRSLGDNEGAVRELGVVGG